MPLFEEEQRRSQQALQSPPQPCDDAVPDVDPVTDSGSAKPLQRLGTRARHFLTAHVLSSLLALFPCAVAAVAAVQAHPEAFDVRENAYVDLRLRDTHAASVGAFMLATEMATALVGFALGIDPFDQPAVGLGKALAKARLSTDG